MEVKIKSLPELKILGKKYNVNFKESNSNPIPAFWGECGSSGLIKKLFELTNNESPLLGICSMSGDCGTFSYWIGVICNNEFEGIEGLDQFTIPSSEYAMVTAKGPCGKVISGAFDYLYGKWIKESSEYEIGTTGYDIEWYDERSCNPDSEDAETDVYIPVKAISK